MSTNRDSEGISKSTPTSTGTALSPPLARNALGVEQKAPYGLLVAGDAKSYSLRPGLSEPTGSQLPKPAAGVADHGFRGP
jgi:hypothetical protein